MELKNIARGCVCASMAWLPRSSVAELVGTEQFWILTRRVWLQARIHMLRTAQPYAPVDTHTPVYRWTMKSKQTLWVLPMSISMSISWPPYCSKDWVKDTQDLPAIFFFFAISCESVIVSK